MILFVKDKEERLRLINRLFRMGINPKEVTSPEDLQSIFEDYGI